MISLKLQISSQSSHQKLEKCLLEAHNKTPKIMQELSRIESALTSLEDVLERISSLDSFLLLFFILASLFSQLIPPLQPRISLLKMGNWNQVYCWLFFYVVIMVLFYARG